VRAVIALTIVVGSYAVLRLTLGTELREWVVGVALIVVHLALGHLVHPVSGGD
jgi:hypothetical protein